MGIASIKRRASAPEAFRSFAAVEASANCCGTLRFRGSSSAMRSTRTSRNPRPVNPAPCFAVTPVASPTAARNRSVSALSVMIHTGLGRPENISISILNIVPSHVVSRDATHQVLDRRFNPAAMLLRQPEAPGAEAQKFAARRVAGLIRDFHFGCPDYDTYTPKRSLPN